MRFLNFTILLVSVLFLASCGSETKPTVVTVDGTAPSALLPLSGTTTVTLDVTDNEQRRLITLTPASTGLSGTFSMAVREWVKIGTTTQIDDITLNGTFTYAAGSTAANLVFTTTTYNFTGLTSVPTIVSPSFSWRTESMALLFTSGKTSGSMQSTKATANGDTESFSGSFILSGHQL